MNRVYWNDGVRDKESWQDRYGVLFRLTGLFAYQVVRLTKKPGNQSLNNRFFLFSFITLVFSIGSSSKAMELRGMFLTTDRASIG